MKSILSFCSILSLGLLISACDISSDAPSANQRLLEDIAEIDAYLSSKSITALKDFRGIRFTIDSPSTSILTGYPARLTDKVTVKYKGKLTNGFIFDSGTLTKVDPQTLIPGFQMGLSMVPIGSKATLYIPSVLGYGSQSTGDIPANSNLIFEIKVLSTVTIASEKTKNAADVTTIETHLNTNAISFQSDTSGLRYRITQTGLGDFPTVFNKVKIKFKASVFKGETFFDGTIEPTAQLDSRIVHYVRGLQLGLIKLNEGSKAVFYVPSPLALGTRSDFENGVSIPANSILQYEIEMLDILDP